MKLITAFVLLITLTLTAASAGPALAQENPTPEPTEEPAEEPAEEAVEELPPAGTPEDVALNTLVQRFDFADQQGWPVGQYSWMADATVANGRYLLTSADITGVMYSGVLDLDDFYAQVEIYPETCPGDGEFGIVFRMSTEPVSDYYFFYVQCEGFFNGGAVSGGATDIKTQGALAQPISGAGAERYVMGVLAQGSEIDLYWNGAYIGGFSDTRRTRGELGLSLSPPSQGEAVTVGFDNLAVWTLPATTAAAETEPPAEAAAAEPEAAETTIPPTRPPDFAFDSAESWGAAGSGFVKQDDLIRAEVVDGRYIITPLTKNAAVFSEMVDVADFYAQYTFTPQPCPPNAFVGFAFRREQPSTYYVFGLRCGGTWLTQAIPPDNPPIVNGQVDAPLSPEGGPYVVGILAQGNQFTIYLNGAEISAFTDDQLAHGDLGFYVQNGDREGEESLSVAVDSLEIWELAPGEVAAAPTEGEGAPPTVQPTDTSAAPTAPPVEVGAVRYETTFDSPGSWVVGSYDFAVAAVENGQYTLTSTDIVSTIRSTSVRAANFYAQYQVTPIQCPGIATFGLPFRISGPTFGNFYVALMQCDGNWRISVLVTDEEGNASGEVLINGTLDAPLTVGEMYTVGVWANGPEIVYYWNGAELGRVTNETHIAGDVGIQIRPSYPDYQLLTIQVDNYQVWNLP